MQYTILPTVEQLNYVQGEWMKLDPFAPEAEKQRVFTLMKICPRCYLSKSGDFGICILDGSSWMLPQPISTVLPIVRQHGGRTDIAWDASGKWVAL